MSTMTASRPARRTMPKAWRDAAEAIRATVAAEITAENYDQFDVFYNVETCSRCGGTGRYSFNLLTLDRCFRCNGATKTYTRAAIKARTALDALRAEVYAVPVEDVKVGDRVKMSGDRKWRLVHEMPEKITCRVGDGNGGWLDCQSIVTNGGAHSLSVRKGGTVQRFSREGAAAVTRAAAMLDGVQVMRRVPVMSA